ncbi:MAG: hypothetical protein FJ271_30795 [Planctomycetes bacterium]|nr:hypothetical protein [Planctomycetota bacterium]
MSVRSEKYYFAASEAEPFGPLVGTEITDANLFHLAPLVCLKFRGKKLKGKAADRAFGDKKKALDDFARNVDRLSARARKRLENNGGFASVRTKSKKLGLRKGDSLMVRLNFIWPNHPAMARHRTTTWTLHPGTLRRKNACGFRHGKVLDGRNPLLLFRFVGTLLLRLDERTFDA